ncbi:GGDEF domain-containing protein [bacterium]|nr:GGDEF domain-containing protein [bacterium]
MAIQSENKKSGIKVKTLNYIMAFITIIISILMLISIFRTRNGYSSLIQTTEDYLNWQKSVDKMQYGSDYLTEQVRMYVETGEIDYLNKYFIEKNITKNREQALEEIKEECGEIDAYDSLLEAMNYSVTLMGTEYYAMRLKAESMSYDISLLPKEIIDVVLSDADNLLSSNEKANLSREKVFDVYYQNEKNLISSKTNTALDQIHEIIINRQEEAKEELRNLIVNEEILTIILIIAVVSIVLITTIEVIKPLIGAIQKIKKEEPMNVTGAYEFRFLAKTYNQMFEANNETKRKLSYDASHDYLTGLYNRNGFDKESSSLDYDNVALIILDIDLFKEVNDEYGHDIGDKILIKLSYILRNTFTTNNIISRYGGDEFVILVIEEDMLTKDTLADLINTVNAELDDTEDSLPKASISAGISFGNTKDIKGLLDKADKALYKTKENGRKGYTFFD